MLGEIRRLTRFASQHEDEFIKAVMGFSSHAMEAKRTAKQKELYALRARDKELDSIFEHLYEDNVAGKLTDDRFAKMSRKYEDEQAELAQRMNALKADLDKETGQSMTTDMFIATVRKYTRAKKLTPRMLNELIDRIEVHHAERRPNEHIQKLVIHYSCVGTLEIPNIVKLPEPEVRLQTRKGVAVNYGGGEMAI